MCIQWGDIPQALIDSSRQRIDEAQKLQLIALDGCPFSGELTRLAGGRLQLDFPFPRNPALREQLIEWALHWGISFTVVV
ncbi:hypothetical protein C7413_107117 [Paraburkholderia silvatlantica]|nr:hypothetical protein C7411_107117 [Paraburkholderia silvatlantica]PXW38796.1 hypothetical protein C7413_107117 [Paraburkholderia silvatlantica]